MSAGRDVEAVRILSLSHIIWTVVLPAASTDLIGFESSLLSLAESLFPLTALIMKQAKPDIVILCREGHLGLVKWAAAHLKFRRGAVTDGFRASCKNGHLEVAKWLAEKFQLTQEDARAEYNYALRWSCENGHLEVAKWLAETFKLTQEDARAYKNWALHCSCEYGHLEVAKWLVERFKLTQEDARNEHRQVTKFQPAYTDFGP